MKCHCLTLSDFQSQENTKHFFLKLDCIFLLVSPGAAGVAAELRLPVDVEPVGGVGDPGGPVGRGLLGELHDALVPQLAHVHLEREQGEHHEAEHGEGHHLRQLLDRVEEGVDDGLEARHDGHCLESSENPEGPETRQVAHVYEGCQVARTDHKKVQPIPRVSQISVIVQNESFG